MDLQEWELLLDDEIHDDGGKKIFSRKYDTDHKTLFKTNYFICPSPNSQKFVKPSSEKNSRVPNQLVVPVPIQFEPTINIAPSVMSEKMEAPNTGGGGAPPDQNMVSQVFFKKTTTENEFVDMKMDSPKSGSRGGIVPQIDAGTFQFEDKSEAMESDNCASKMEVEKEMVRKTINLDSDMREENSGGGGGGGSNIWKWSSTGIGAICSFGVAAAATLCIIILGSSQRNKQLHQNQKLRFQIYTDDKRIKQVVHHATKLNEAISAVRGVPLTRAHITFGGYYDAL
uniref:DUF6821 domain-containing protein n=1 Tax=Davidia involucrata TaxID=16924 RepID=A0A5B6ZDX5_DAVIN